jgi:peptidoglycan/xylan/chitin deacetylase (PgdA/CDA1 family)
MATPIVRALVRAGWELACHTVTHLDLTELEDDELDKEIRLSRRILRVTFGVPVDFFCYPSGHHDQRVVAVVRDAGYLGATTSLPGLACPGDPFRLRRVRIGDGDDALTLGLRLDSLLSRLLHKGDGPEIVCGLVTIVRALAACFRRELRFPGSLVGTPATGPLC